MKTHFDIKAYLNEKNIPFKTSGKNIGRGWIGTSCPFCGDNRNHLGIRDFAFSCWRCGSKGSLFKFVLELEDKDVQRAKRVIQKHSLNKYETYTLDNEAAQEERERLSSPFHSPSLLSLFNSFKTTPEKTHERYLESRRFDTQELVRRYNIRFSHVLGAYKHRIIIPVYENAQLVSFVARDVTNKAELRYKNPPNEISAKSSKSVLYNLDNATSESVIVVEGPTDVWRMGNNCVSTLGTQYTPSQVVLLSRFRHIYILFDSAATSEAEKLADDLSCFSLVHIVSLDMNIKDPAKLTQEEARNLKRELRVP